MDRGTTVDASELLVSNVTVESGGGAGWGLIVETGAMATVARTVVDRCARVGIQCFDGGSRLQLTDSVIRDTQPSRVVIERNSGAGLLAASGGSATLSDSIVRDSLIWSRPTDAAWRTVCTRRTAV